MFSIVILTFNEEDNIEACIRSVEWCDDVIVLDSMSTDRTCEIADDLGARVFSRRFDNFANQRNFAIDFIDSKYSWVFHLDADERFNEDLRKECEIMIQRDEKSAFFIPNRMMFMGRWIRRCSQYPYPQVRLIKKGEIRFSVSGHGQREGASVREIGHIDVPYDHYNFSKGIADWLSKHNRYSDEEARILFDTKREPFAACFSTDSMIRKRALKSWFIRMPYRPLVKFFYLFIVRGGVLDGIPGFHYCVLQYCYEFMIVLKVKEIKRRSAGLTI